MIRSMLNIYVLPTATQIGLQQSQSIQMDQISAFYDEITFYLIVILTFVSYMLVRALWVYTSEKKSLSLTQGHELEFIWTTVPSVILAAIAIPSFILLYQLDLSYKPDMTLKVIGHQWYWSYEYPRIIPKSIDSFNKDPLPLRDTHYHVDAYMIQEQDLTIGYRLLETLPIVLEDNINIRCIVTSSDVLHSWALPSLGVKMDAVPGRLNQIMLTYHNTTGGEVTAAYGQCSELCGSEHAQMPIKLLFRSFKPLFIK